MPIINHLITKKYLLVNHGLGKYGVWFNNNVWYLVYGCDNNFLFNALDFGIPLFYFGEESRATDNDWGE